MISICPAILVFFSTPGSYYECMTSDKGQYIDLHTHSNCSDGAFSPAELVQLAHKSGLSAIAIADHDSVAGVTEGVEAAACLDIEIIPAVELSVQFKTWQDVHLLGYGLDCSEWDFVRKLSGFRERRRHRNEEILARVNECLSHEKRTPIELAEVLVHARDAIGRPHIARVLLERGYAKSIEDAFRCYLSPCDVPKQYWPIDDAVAEVRRLGGVAVLAHPTSISKDRQELRQIVAEMSQIGVDGIEVFNNLAQAHEMEFLRRRAEEAGLLITGGSDFHGIEEGLEIGRGRGGIRFSATFLAPLRKLITERQQMIKPTIRL